MGDGVAKYRPHRGGLAESMAETVEINSKDDLVKFLLSNYAPFLADIASESVHIKPYGYDKRIDWDTHIVTIDGQGVVGFTDKMIY